MLQYYEPAKDFGTPARVATTSVALTIDGVAIEVPEGSSVMHAAAVAGIKVPKLCATDALEPFGSCRVCLVEIEGRKGFPASCTTTVAEGMEVRGTVYFRSSAGLPDLRCQR
jgi:formate dehydrogenase major subunit